MKAKLMIVVFFLVSSSPVFADVQGRVSAVLDGDTVDVVTEQGARVRVRLNMIDAPEKDQAYGLESRSALNNILYGKTVRVDDSAGKDKYGRTIGVIYYQGQNINLWMVMTGNAWEYKKYSTNPSLKAAENRARKESIGLWTGVNPTPPWEWRHTASSKVKRGNTKTFSRKNAASAFSAAGKQIRALNNITRGM